MKLFHAVGSEGTADNDIVAETVNISFPAGADQQAHMINNIQDIFDEDNEKFFVTLVEKSGIMLGPSSSETLIIVC